MKHWFYILYCFGMVIPIRAMRNPFEITQEQNNASEKKTISAESSPTTTWQMTQIDDTTLILKNQEGEIREIRLNNN